MDPVAAIVRFNAMTAARDKMCRLVQYISRFVWYYLQRHGYSADFVTRFKQLEGAISTARKLFRIGKSVDVLQSAAATLHHPDLLVRCTLTFSKVNTALFLVFDHIVWGCRIGIFPKTDKAYWGHLSNRFWLVSLSALLLRDFYELKRLVQERMARQPNASGDGRLNQRQQNRGRAGSSIRAAPGAIAATCVRHPEVVLDTIKNMADFLLPLGNLDLISSSPGLLGLCGTVSSAIGTLVLCDDRYKIRPS
ncbi:peroxisomal membrane protein 11B-like [Sycon ciliatum]|uniref:peroxisomal membrane protein 11B-like n=1 Tax=Sycon ciliatum TaxID=27933 RepID=UPI0020ABFA55|eukprot:scpid84125/ scgid14357/ Peroxisomal membrane protein 11B; Peroxin-11B; Peroxisomal biogenesis factor 11B